MGPVSGPCASGLAQTDMQKNRRYTRPERTIFCLQTGEATAPAVLRSCCFCVFRGDRAGASAAQIHAPFHWSFCNSSHHRTPDQNRVACAGAEKPLFLGVHAAANFSGLPSFTHRLKRLGSCPGRPRASAFIVQSGRGCLNAVQTGGLYCAAQDRVGKQAGHEGPENAAEDRFQKKALEKPCPGACACTATHWAVHSAEKRLCIGFRAFQQALRASGKQTCPAY